MWVWIISIHILHVLKCNNPSPYRVLPTKMPVVCLQGFHVPISVIPLQVMTQNPLGKCVYLCRPCLPFFISHPYIQFCTYEGCGWPVGGIWKDTKTVLYCDLSPGTSRPLVHLHQQPKTPFLLGRPGGVPAWGMLWEILSHSELTADCQQVIDCEVYLRTWRIINKRAKVN